MTSQKFMDIDGNEHTVLLFNSHGTRQNYMITTIEINGLTFPQVWESKHTGDETPVWFQRRTNNVYTLADIISNTILGPVGNLNNFDWKEMEHKS